MAFPALRARKCKDRLSSRSISISMGTPCSLTKTRRRMLKALSNCFREKARLTRTLEFTVASSSVAESEGEQYKAMHLDSRELDVRGRLSHNESEMNGVDLG